METRVARSTSGLVASCAGRRVAHYKWTGGCGDATKNVKPYTSKNRARTDRSKWSKLTPSEQARWQEPVVEKCCRKSQIIEGTVTTTSSKRNLFFPKNLIDKLLLIKKLQLPEDMIEYLRNHF